MSAPLHITDHWLDQARRVRSPHCNARPAGVAVDLLVLHCISLPPGEFGGPFIEQLFMGVLPAGGHPYFAGIHALRVSAHMLIRRDGELVQFVPFDQRAWHAGVSHYQGRENCNDFSIGIELEGTDSGPFAPVQYQVLAQLMDCLFRAYPGLCRQRVAAHSEIAPGRKTDPGTGFDWAHLNGLLDRAAGGG